MDSSGRQADKFNLQSGDIVANRYEICERIGSGGMGMVFRVIDRELDNEVVALKLLHSHLAQDETVFRRFRNEVLVARSLSHPNIVRTHDIGRDDQGFSYISMEFVDGVSLKDFLLSKADNAETVAGADGSTDFRGALDFEEAVSILCQIISGISYAHGKDVIHRDLKPANVMIASDGEVKLADFGTARILGMDTSITRTGQVIGTPDYMSPEQIRGEALDQTCDIYALGIIAFELVAGRRPFAADTPVAVAYKHLNEPLPDFVVPELGVPLWYDEVVRKATAKKKSERFSTATEFGRTIFEHMPELANSSGYFNVDGTAFIRSGSYGTSTSPENEVEATVKREKPKADGFELGKSAASSGSGWTLDFSEEELSADKQIITTEESTSKKNSWLGRVVLLLLVVAGAAAGVKYNENLNAKFKEIAPPMVLALLEDSPAPVVEPSVGEGQRDALMDELLGGLPEELKEEKKEKKKVEKAKPPVAKSKPPKKKEPKRKEEVKKAETKKPEPKKEEPAKIVKTIPVTGSLEITQQKKVITSQSVSIDRLSSVEWKAEINGLSGGDKNSFKKQLALNIFDPTASKVIAKLKPDDIKLSKDGETPVLFSGNLAGIKDAKPSTGDFRVDLVYNGEVLTSQPLALSIARVKFSSRVQPGNRLGGAGGKVAIVRGPKYVPPKVAEGSKEKKKPVEAAPPVVEKKKVVEKATVKKSEEGQLAEEDLIAGAALPSPTADPRVVAIRSARERDSSYVPVNTYNQPSIGLPPARTPTGTTPQLIPRSIVPKQDDSSLQKQDSFSDDEPSPAVRESYGGTLNYNPKPGQAGEKRAMVLNLSFSGSKISGSASVAGFNPFIVSGKVYPRGIEMELSSAEVRIRLTGVKRAKLLRGSYLIRGQNLRGAWQVSQTK